MVKADFSIIKNIIENDYRRVLLQQGRVLTDSDINEYQAIIDQLRQKYLRDTEAILKHHHRRQCSSHHKHGI